MSATLFAPKSRTPNVCVSSRAKFVGIRRRAVALALIGLLGVHLDATDVLAATDVGTAQPHNARRDVAQQLPGPHAPTTWTVQNCDDSGSGSLRAVLLDPMLAGGDIVDLGQLPGLCAMRDSVITLSTGELVVAQDDLILQGPPAADGTVTISAAGASRVLRHNGVGTLSIFSLELTNG